MKDIKKNKRRPLWARLLLWLFGVVGIIAAILLIVVTLTVWILTPPKLTPLIEKIGSEYLNADVRVKRVELSYWSTFPKLTVEVDSLAIISRSLRDLSPDQRAQLPESADTLFSIEHFSGGVHMLYLLKNNVSLYDVQLRKPMLNIVELDSAHVNYDIVPPSDVSESSVPAPIPTISFNRFEITGGFPMRYFNAADTVDVTLLLADSHLLGDSEPVYKLSMKGIGSSAIPALPIDSLELGLDGDIKWDPAVNPMGVELKDFNISVGRLSAMLDAKLDFTDSLKVKSLDVDMPHLRISDAIDIVPSNMRGELARIQTDVEVNIRASLIKPYSPSDKMPSLKLSVDIPDGKLIYDRLRLNRINAAINAVIDGENLDKSVIDVEKFTAVAQSVGFSVSAHITNPISDPYVKGKFKGGISFTKLPDMLWHRMGFEMTGLLTGDADFKFRQSWLSPNKFHKVMVNGHLALNDFTFSSPSQDLFASLGRASFDLGSRSSVKINDVKVDSLLTASLSIDTLYMATQGVHVSAKELTAGVGARNISSSLDTTQINPMGGNIRAQLIKLQSDSDSVAVLIRNSGIRASLRRFNGMDKAPLLSLTLGAERIRYADRLNRMTLRNAISDMTLHPRKRRELSPRMKARIDSLSALYPELPQDSVMRLAFVRSHKFSSDSVSNRENVDFGLDNSLKALLMRWQLEGNIKAERGRLLTPYFPLLNRLRNFDMSFGTDSVVMRNIRVLSGRSDFLLNGRLTNISRALTSRRGRPLMLNFSLTSDTIDINQITDALLAGAAFADKLSKGEVKISNSDNDDAVQTSIENAAPSTERMALVVPSNIQANLNVSAKHVLYGDIWLERFKGDVDVYDGAISLNPIMAKTSVGSVAMSALYSAPSIDSLSFAAGVNIRRLRLDDVLDMVGGLDTIMPLLKSVEGIVDADLAVSAQLDSMLNFNFPSLDMALKLNGDSLVLLDSETFRTLSKWLMFKNKKRNMIDNMTVEMVVKDSRLSLYPFIFDMDRYRLGVSGGNDLGLNLDYHVAVLKSPLPFKFGINIKGTPDDMKIRVGKARLNEKSVATTKHVTDTLRINLVNEIAKAFKSGMRRRRNTPRLSLDTVKMPINVPSGEDNFSKADSVALIQQGLITAPDGFVMPDSVSSGNSDKKTRKANKKRKK